MAIFLLVLGLVLFVGLVIVHELGHFWMARRGGVEVEEFGLGFPPRAKVLKTHNGTKYTLNWLPLGGFVKLKGEHVSDKTPGSFGAASLLTKVKIMVAGVVMNLATAYVLLTLVALIGMPRLVDNQFAVASDTRVTRQEVLVGYVEPDSPADTAGLETRDHIKSIGPDNQEQTVSRADDLPGMTERYAGQTVNISYVREGEEHRVSTELRPRSEVEASRNTDDPKGYLGLSPAEYTVQRSTWSAPIVAGGLIGQLTAETFQGIGRALYSVFTGNGGQAAEQVAGPVGIFVILRDGSLLGPEFVLLIVALISLTLAIINILPIPALDGGRLFVTLVFHAIRRPLTKRTEDMIHGTGFVLLMALFVLITVVDVRRFF